MSELEGLSLVDEGDLLRKLESKSEELTNHVQAGDMASAFAVIQQINVAKEEGIFHGLGVLARGLHTAISGFELDESGKAYLAHSDTSALQVTG